MKTLWFTFGQTHVHSSCGRTFDKDTVVKITSDDPRTRMVELFGVKWGMQYNEKPDMKYFKEIIEL